MSITEQIPQTVRKMNTGDDHSMNGDLPSLDLSQTMEVENINPTDHPRVEG